MSDQQRDQQDGMVSLLVGLGVGFLLGGVTALLLAPQPGSQTRAQLRETMDDRVTHLKDSVDDLRHKLDEVAQSARQAVASRRSSRDSEGPRTGDVAGATDEIA